MAKPEPKKRDLTFDQLDDIVVDTRRLLSGYRRNGNWTLGQTCSHIADWMQFPLDGFPKPPLFMRVMFGIMKYTVAPGMKKKILRDGFKGGMPTAPETVPDADAMPDSQGVEKLEKIIARLKTFQGELHPSPLFGPVDSETHLKVSMLHAAHHLGYLEPE